MSKCPTCHDMHWIPAYGRNGRTMIACPTCLPAREARVLRVMSEDLGVDEAVLQDLFAVASKIAGA
jgi:hypothetical protein